MSKARCELSSRDPKQRSDYVLAIDIDGVLVHPSEEFAGGAWDSHIAADLGIDPEALGKKFFARLWPEIVIGRRDLKESLAGILPELQPNIGVDEFIAYWFEHDSRVDEAVADILQEWRKKTGGRSVAVSNQEKYRVAYLRNDVGLNDLFDYILWSGDLGLTKSNPEFYSVAVDRLGVAPEYVWFFDDDIRNVELAAKAGWNAHLFVSVDEMRAILAPLVG